MIATDGSKFSETAVETICGMIGQAEDTEIKIVSAYEHPLMADAAPYSLPTAYNPVIDKELSELANQAVMEARQKITDGLSFSTKNVKTEILFGSPERVIVEEAENWGADLIVVGSHGYGFWERMFLGSVSNAIVHHAPCSVLIVRGKQTA